MLLQCVMKTSTRDDDFRTECEGMHDLPWIEWVGASIEQESLTVSRTAERAPSTDDDNLMPHERWLAWARPLASIRIHQPVLYRKCGKHGISGDMFL
jgi:hypothetical protein